MKSFKFFLSISIATLFLNNCLADPSYILIDLASPDNNEIVLTRKDTDSQKCRIYLYNIWSKDNSGNNTILTTVSVLPDLHTGTIKWDTLSAIPASYQVVNINQIAAKTIDYYYSNCKTFSPNGPYPTKSTSYIPIIRKENYYLIPRLNENLTEFYKYYPKSVPFAIEDYDEIGIFPFGIPYSINDIKKIIIFFSKNFHGNIHYIDKILPSGDTLIFGKIKEYIFWRTPPPVLDAGWILFGIGDFNFIPCVGIITGSYKEYFRGGETLVLRYPLKFNFKNDNELFKPVKINGIPFKDYLARYCSRSNHHQK